MKLKEEQIKKKLKDISNWEFKDDVLYGNYEFKDFKEAFSVMTRIAFEAEAMQHHPDWTNVYNTLEIRLTTHDEGGVTQKDFEMAKKIDEVI